MLYQLKFIKFLLIISFFYFMNSCLSNDEVKSSYNIDNQSNILNTFSNITCPFCGFTANEKLPEEYCLIKYNCPKCNKNIYPKEGDCCVFCSYGTHNCPSIQELN